MHNLQIMIMIITVVITLRMHDHHHHLITAHGRFPIEWGQLRRGLRSTDGASRLAREPPINARHVESVCATRQTPSQLTFLQNAQTHSTLEVIVAV